MTRGAHVDPVKLREFADTLAKTVGDYRRSVEWLDNRLRSLGASWRDDAFEAFAREVRTTRTILEEFILEGEKAHAILLRDAEAAEAAARLRYS